MDDLAIWRETIVMDNSWTIERWHYPDGSTFTHHHLRQQTGTVPDELITWRGEPLSYTSHAPELNTETGTVTPYEWSGY